MRTYGTTHTTIRQRERGEERVYVIFIMSMCLRLSFFLLSRRKQRVKGGEGAATVHLHFTW